MTWGSMRKNEICSPTPYTIPILNAYKFYVNFVGLESMGATREIYCFARSGTDEKRKKLHRNYFCSVFNEAKYKTYKLLSCHPIKFLNAFTETEVLLNISCTLNRIRLSLS